MEFIGPLKAGYGRFGSYGGWGTVPHTNTLVQGRCLGLGGSHEWGIEDGPI